MGSYKWVISGVTIVIPDFRGLISALITYCNLRYIL